MTHSETITFRSGDETLVGTIDWNAARDKPTVLSLHGGGESARKRAAPTTEKIAELGFSCLRFDFSGQGDSSDQLRQSSFKKRLAETLDAAAFLDPDKPLTVIGTSMGGPTAVELTRHLNVGTLVLFCPAIYAAQAFDMSFDERLTEILRRPNSYEEADLSALKNFSGRFFHILGERKRSSLPLSAPCICGMPQIHLTMTLSSCPKQATTCMTGWPSIRSSRTCC